MESSKTLVLSPDVKCLPSVINEVPDHKFAKRRTGPMARGIHNSRREGTRLRCFYCRGIGGCLSALSSLRCGFRHIFTTETDPHKMEMAELLTRAPCIGDTFAHEYKQLRARYGHCSYLKSGQPCVDYSSPGPQTGRGKDCRTGWMYTAQGQCILELEPDVVCLEQVAHIMKVDKSAVKEIIEKL